MEHSTHTQLQFNVTTQFAAMQGRLWLSVSRSLHNRLSSHCLDVTSDGKWISARLSVEPIDFAACMRLLSDCNLSTM